MTVVHCHRAESRGKGIIMPDFAWVETATDADRLSLAEGRFLKEDRLDVVDRIRRRRYELAGRNARDPLEADLERALVAYEDLLRQKHGRKQPAGRTRQMLKRHGPVGAVTRTVLKGSVTAS